jgi:hypothetical protein
MPQSSEQYLEQAERHRTNAALAISGHDRDGQLQLAAIYEARANFIERIARNTVPASRLEHAQTP